MNFLLEIKKYIQTEWYNLKHHHKIKMITLFFLIILFPLTIPLAITGFIYGMLMTIIPGKKEYDESLYKLITKKSYFTTIFNKGNIAEYYTWRILDKQSEYKKVLINLYIPNGDHTNEIDSILINEYGIFVIESKGYSGWIFGNEVNQNWIQVIYNNKYKFYNPVIQNRNHIKALAKILEIENMNIFRSYVVFSERCVIKKMIVKKPNVKVIKRLQLQDTLNKDYETYGKVLTNNQIKNIYDKLTKYMFTNDDTKKEHIKYVETMKNAIK